ncbi:hypothetical protein C8J57DRAFT_1245650 [Mycena rebaudengoi]|nr:hypothetical protein C8J57DRAFT_1245650 [Mycena rebaudengoi]
MQLPALLSSWLLCVLAAAASACGWYIYSWNRGQCDYYGRIKIASKLAELSRRSPALDRGRPVYFIDYTNQEAYDAAVAELLGRDDELPVCFIDPSLSQQGSHRSSVF